MNDELRDLYQEVIIDHSKRPRNFREIENADRKIDGYNPLCGDKITLFLNLDGDTVTDVSFKGEGCAISTASASMLTEMLKGRKVAEVEAMFDEFHRLVAEDVPVEDIDADTLGKLRVFGGIRDFPMRVKCATLSWHALKAALKEPDADQVTTE